MDEFGPVQILVVGFDDPDFEGEILRELRALGSWTSFASSIS
jgi:hypothetical protein